MPQVSQDDIPWVEQRSPNDRFHTNRKHLSLALGGVKDAGPWAEGIRSTWN